MSGERPDFQQPTGITSQLGGVASAEEFAAQSDDIGVNVDLRTIGAGNSATTLLDPNLPNSPAVIQRVFLRTDSASPAQVTLQVRTNRNTFTGTDAKLFSTAAQAPVAAGPGFFVAPGFLYAVGINNNTSSSVRTNLAVVLRRVE